MNEAKKRTCRRRCAELKRQIFAQYAEPSGSVASILGQKLRYSSDNYLDARRPPGWQRAA